MLISSHGHHYTLPLYFQGGKTSDPEKTKTRGREALGRSGRSRKIVESRLHPKSALYNMASQRLMIQKSNGKW